MNFEEISIKLGRDLRDMRHYVILLFIIVSALLFFYYVSFVRFREQIYQLEVKVQKFTEEPNLERLSKI